LPVHLDDELNPLGLQSHDGAERLGPRVRLGGPANGVGNRPAGSSNVSSWRDSSESDDETGSFRVQIGQAPHFSIEG
jgi:hypothetical protein